MRTKRELVLGAFEEIGLASYVFDITPDELQAALRRMDQLMATWNSKGIRIGYSMGGGLDADCGLSDEAELPVLLNLGIALAPQYGKQISQDTRISARQAYDALLAKAIDMPQMQQSPLTPRGAGYKRRWNIFNHPIDPIDTGKDGELEFK